MIKYFSRVTFLLGILTLTSCIEPDEAPGLPYILHPSTMPITVDLMSPEEYQKECKRHEWYFCDLNGGERMMVTKDICQDPPIVLEVGECEEFLECDPTVYHLEIIECITSDGFPGTQNKICSKGKIQYTDCITLCEEEVCDGEDNDCDDQCLWSRH